MVTGAPRPLCVCRTSAGFIESPIVRACVCKPRRLLKQHIFHHDVPVSVGPPCSLLSFHARPCARPAAHLSIRPFGRLSAAVKDVSLLWLLLDVLDRSARAVAGADLNSGPAKPARRAAAARTTAQQHRPRPQRCLRPQRSVRRSEHVSGGFPTADPHRRDLRRSSLSRQPALGAPLTGVRFAGSSQTICNMIFSSIPTDSHGTESHAMPAGRRRCPQSVVCKRRCRCIRAHSRRSSAFTRSRKTGRVRLRPDRAWLCASTCSNGLHDMFDTP